MKKLALLLALLMAVMSFVACGNTNDDKGKTSGDGNTTASDVDYVKNKGTLIVGITDFAPMDYREKGSNEWIGFDADMAKEFAKELGVKAEFVEITNWDNKSIELQTKAVDVVWNGMTLTDDVKQLMGTSEPYCKNAQVVVTKADKADGLKTAADIKDLSFVVENGSAGAEALDAEKIKYTAVDTQAKALMEVKAGSADATVIDLLMAQAMVGEGTDYADLKMTEVGLTNEEYGVGFRKGSDLVSAFNSFWKKAYDAGTVMKTAEKYNIAKNIIEK